MASKRAARSRVEARGTVTPPHRSGSPGEHPKDHPHHHGVRDRAQQFGRALGLGVITGAADDDPSAIGTYASAGAKLGPSFLWTAPATYPMMVAVIYLSSKLGQVTGKGLIAVIKEHYPRWVLWSTLAAVLVGDTIEAGADLGGMAAAAGILIPIPTPWIAVGAAALILSLQIFASYALIRRVFRWLALTLLAYIGAALLAKPDLMDVVRGTFLPTLRFDREFLSLLVAVIGTTLSTYLYTWQSNQEVEEKIASGKHHPDERRGTSEKELRATRWDIATGMFFSNVIMYFIILSTASTLYEAEGTTSSPRRMRPGRSLRSPEMPRARSLRWG